MAGPSTGLLQDSTLVPPKVLFVRLLVFADDCLFSYLNLTRLFVNCWRHLRRAGLGTWPVGLRSAHGV